MRIKNYHITIALLISCLTVIGQEHILQTSILIGPNWSKLKGDLNIQGGANHLDFVYPDRYVGINAGISIQANLSDLFSLKTGAFWSQRKGSGKIVDYNTSESNWTNSDLLILDFINIPLMARFNFGNKIGYFVQFGPYIGIPIQAKAGGHDYLNLYETNEFGYYIGLGLTYDLNKNLGLELEFGYANGLNGISFGPTTGTLTNSINSKIGIVYKLFERKKG